MKRRVPTEEECAQSPEAMLLRGAEEREESAVATEVTRALRRLPPRERLVATYRWLKGMTRAEVEEKLELTAKEVRCAEERARRKLIAALVKAGVV